MHIAIDPVCRTVPCKQLGLMVISVPVLAGVEVISGGSVRAVCFLLVMALSAGCAAFERPSCSCDSTFKQTYVPAVGKAPAYFLTTEVCLPCDGVEEGEE